MMIRKILAMVVFGLTALAPLSYSIEIQFSPDDCSNLEEKTGPKDLDQRSVATRPSEASGNQNQQGVRQEKTRPNRPADEPRSKEINID